MPPKKRKTPRRRARATNENTNKTNVKVIVNQPARRQRRAKGQQPFVGQPLRGPQIVFMPQIAPQVQAPQPNVDFNRLFDLLSRRDNSPQSIGDMAFVGRPPAVTMDDLFSTRGGSSLISDITASIPEPTPTFTPMSSMTNTPVPSMPSSPIPSINFDDIYQTPSSARGDFYEQFRGDNPLNSFRFTDNMRPPPSELNESDNVLMDPVTSEEMPFPMVDTKGTQKVDDFANVSSDESSDDLTQILNPRSLVKDRVNFFENNAATATLPPGLKAVLRGDENRRKYISKQANEIRQKGSINYDSRRKSSFEKYGLVPFTNSAGRVIGIKNIDGETLV